MKRETSPKEKFTLWFYTAMGKNIHDARIKTGDTQEALASALSISRVSIVNIENGKQRLPIHLLFAIAELLSTSVDKLLPNKSDYQP